MSAIRFLAADKLASWLAEVAASRQVLAPRQEGKAVVFRPLVAGETPSLARATVSPKAAVFPACETLVHFTGTKDPENPAKLNMKLDDTPDAPARMVFGCRSCDARGFAVLDKPFLEGKFQDAYYKARRDNLLVVTRTCDSPCSTCFCHWTGGGPADPTGSDVLLTAVNGGFVLEAVSEKGEAFLASTKLADGSDKMDEAKAAREKAAASQQPAPDLSKAARRLEQRFTDVDFWAEQTAKSPAARAPTCARPASASTSPTRAIPSKAAACAAGTTACPRCSPARPAGTTPARPRPCVCATAFRTSTGTLPTTATGVSPARAAVGASSSARCRWTSVKLSSTPSRMTRKPNKESEHGRDAQSPSA